MSRAITSLAEKSASPLAKTSGHSGGIPHFPKYHETDNIEDFIVQFEGLATVHSYDEAKKKASFLALLPSTTFQLLKNLIYPSTFDTETYENLKLKLTAHLKPTPLRIPSRHATFWNF